MTLTDKQRAVFNFILSKAVNGLSRAPMAKIAAHLGLNGGGAQVINTINVLLVKGFIQRISPDATCRGNVYKILKTK